MIWAFFSQLSAAVGGLLFLYLLTQKPSYWVVAVTAAYPIVTLVIGVLFLKESLTPAHIVGVVMVVSGLMFLQMK